MSRLCLSYLSLIFGYGGFKEFFWVINGKILRTIPDKTAYATVPRIFAMHHCVTSFPCFFLNITISVGKLMFVPSLIFEFHPKLAKCNMLILTGNMNHNQYVRMPLIYHCNIAISYLLFQFHYNHLGNLKVCANLIFEYHL